MLPLLASPVASFQISLNRIGRMISTLVSTDPASQHPIVRIMPLSSRICDYRELQTAVRPHLFERF